jgi:hypothetical protein
MSGNMILRSLALFVAAVSVSSVRLAAQDQQSVADAARQARQQKQAAAKPAHVVDNDSIPPAPIASTAPSEAASSASASSEANPPAPGAPSTSDLAGKAETPQETPADKEAEEARKKAEIETLKQQIADKQKIVDLQRREIALSQDSYYSNPDHEHDTSGKQKLDSMQSDLKQQQDELVALRAKLGDLAPQAVAKSPEPEKQ